MKKQDYGDKRYAKTTESRRKPYVATIEEYASYFAANPRGKKLRIALEKHAQAPEQTMTAGELADAVGYKGFQAINSQYGILGKGIAREFGLTLPRAQDNDDIEVATFALADEADPPRTAQGHWRWQMHPEVREALQALGRV